MAYFAIVVGRDAGNRFDFLEVVANLLSLLSDAFYHFGHGFVDTTFQIHGVGTGSHVLKTYVYDSLSQYGSRSRTVAGIVARLRGNLFNQLGTHVLERVFQFNLFGNRHTIFRDVGSTEFFLDDDVAAFRTQGDFNGISQLVYTFFQLFASLNIEFNFFSHSSFSF